ncbi:Ammonium transporter [Trema orientale]|uniref:Ammonium transporter n=1 Tax=Trema orientale TaxID=63057 RepID=A0A2P5FJU1_TREOI|nr:Ammonium transporter [Trema orientale]
MMMSTTTYLKLLFFTYSLFLIQHYCFMSSIRAKNTILANVVAITGSLLFYSFGFVFSFGARFSSTGADYSTMSSLFLSQWAFAITAGCITNTLLAGRTRFGSHLVCSFFLSGVVYPVVAHWVWSPYGWLSAINYAGCGALHLVGGIAGILGSLIGGPRVMGQPNNSRMALPKMGASARAVMVIVGLLLLLFGWFGYNQLGCFAKIFEAYASTTNQGNWILLGRSATVTMLAISTAGIVTPLGRWLLVGHWDELDAFIGLVGGVAAISSGCSVVEPWAAVVCGFSVAFVLIGLSHFVLRLRFDDPFEAAQLYCWCGALGLIFTGLFAKEEFVIQTYNSSGESVVSRPFGLLVGGGWGLLGAQVVELLVIVGWVSATMGPLFWILHKLRILRISNDEEIASFEDISGHRFQENHAQFGDYTPMQMSNGDSKDHQHSYGLYLLM